MTLRNLKKILIPMAIIPILYLGIYLLNSPTPRIYLNLSNSEPLGIYRRIPFDGHLQTSELVFLVAPEQARPYIYGRGWLPEGWLLLKSVGALTGDKVTISNDSIKIKGVYTGPVLDKDNEGKPLPRLRGDIHIPAAHFLPIASRINNSFDGRYFGPVSYQLIQGKAIPVFTF